MVNRKMRASMMKKGRSSSSGSLVVKVFGLEQGGMYSTGKHRRHAKLCQLANLPSDGQVGPLIVLNPVTHRVLRSRSMQACDELELHARRRVTDGLSPNTARYSTEKRPKL